MSIKDMAAIAAARTLAAQRELEGLQHGEVPTPRVTFEHGDRQPLDEKSAENLVSMTFKSRSGSTQPHIVTVHVDDSVSCTCPASNPCWATLAFRRVRGMYYG